jgi:hypothetical protein
VHTLFKNSLYSPGRKAMRLTKARISKYRSISVPYSPNGFPSAIDYVGRLRHPYFFVVLNRQ